MNTLLGKALTKCLAGAAGACAALAAGDSADAGVAYALTGDNRILQFDTASPGSIDRTTAISGLHPFEDLLGIDSRPADPNNLYGVSSFGATYKVNPVNGTATAVGPALDPAALPLDGDRYGLDFNPAVDRIRLVSDLSENYRLNPNDGSLAAADGKLAYKAGDANAGFPPLVAAVAYTNSDTDPSTGTTLYGLDTDAGVLVTIDPPNDGTLNTVGSLNQSQFPLYTGFDILGPDNRAFAFSTFEQAFDVFEQLDSTLYTVDLETGEAVAVGTIGDGSYVITGGAVTATAIPLPPAVLAFPIAAGIAGFVQYRTRRRARQLQD